MPKAKNSTEQVTLNVKASPTVQAALLEGEERSQSEVLRSAIHAYIAAKQAARNRNAHGVPDHVVAFIPTPLELEEMVAAAGAPRFRIGSGRRSRRPFAARRRIA